MNIPGNPTNKPVPIGHNGQLGMIVRPQVSPVEALGAWKEYQTLKQKIIDPKIDIQQIGKEKFLKKSYWRKIATFFNLSVEKVDEDHEQLGKTHVWHFTCKAIAPNKRFAIGTGSCDTYEKAKLVNGQYVTRAGTPAIPNSLHNIRSTAETRAFNRAVSNLVGGGEVSAEEINSQSGQPVYTPAQSAPVRNSAPAQKPVSAEYLQCSDCNNMISEAEYKFSKDRFKKVLCRACQANH